MGDFIPDRTTGCRQWFRPVESRSVKLTDATTLRERLNISRLALAHPRTTIAVWALVAIAGIWAYGHLRLALFPDVTFPLVVITAEAPGLSPQEVEAGITLPIEQRMHGLRDLKRLESSSSPGKAIVAVEFEVGVSLREARRARGFGARAASSCRAERCPARARSTSTNRRWSRTCWWASTAPRHSSWARRSAPSCRRSRRCLACCTWSRSGSIPWPWRNSADTAVDSTLPHTVAWLNGQQGVALEVVKEAGANTIEVVRQVDSVVQPAAVGESGYSRGAGRDAGRLHPRQHARHDRRALACRGALGAGDLSRSSGAGRPPASRRWRSRSRCSARSSS